MLFVVVAVNIVEEPHVSLFLFVWLSHTGFKFWAIAVHEDIGCACTHVPNVSQTDLNVFGRHYTAFKILAKSLHGQWRYFIGISRSQDTGKTMKLMVEIQRDDHMR